MVAITLPITAVVAEDAQNVEYQAGVVILQGQFVYLNTTTRKIALARADVVGTKGVLGMARNGAGAANAPVDVARNGRITGVSGLTAGLYYVLSPDTAGAIAPIVDLGSTEYNVLIGLADTTTSLIMYLKDWGYALA